MYYIRHYNNLCMSCVEFGRHGCTCIICNSGVTNTFWLKCHWAKRWHLIWCEAVWSWVIHERGTLWCTLGWQPSPYCGVPWLPDLCAIPTRCWSWGACLSGLGFRCRGMPFPHTRWSNVGSPRASSHAEDAMPQPGMWPLQTWAGRIQIPVGGSVVLTRGPRWNRNDPHGSMESMAPWWATS